MNFTHSDKVDLNDKTPRMRTLSKPVKIPCGFRERPLTEHSKNGYSNLTTVSQASWYYGAGPGKVDVNYMPALRKKTPTPPGDNLEFELSQGNTETKRQSIQSVEVGIRLLEVLMAAEDSLPLRTIAATAEMSRSQTHRYLLSYVNTGLVRQDAATGCYELGPLAMRLGVAALGRTDFVARSSERLEILVRTTGYTGVLTIWGDAGPTIIRWVHGKQRMVTSMGLGSVLPILTSSAGKIYLAFLPRSHTKSFIQAERKSSTAGEKNIDVNAIIRTVRQAGYAELKESIIPGLMAVSAPVFDSQGVVVATIGLMSRASDQLYDNTAAISSLIEASEGASRAIGWLG